MQDKNLGFTLIEILIVLLMLSMLALMAYPSYISYIYKSNRLDAVHSLFHYQGEWQRCQFQTLQSETCLAQMGLGPGQIRPSLSEHYAITADWNESILRFIARPIRSQANDIECVEFILDILGGMKAYNANGVESTKACW